MEIIKTPEVFNKDNCKWRMAIQMKSHLEDIHSESRGYVAVVIRKLSSASSSATSSVESCEDGNGIFNLYDGHGSGASLYLAQLYVISCLLSPCSWSFH